MKTLKQKKLDELAKEMPSINEKGQQAVMVIIKLL